jgi:Circularly permutated YpsA SLOG family
MFAGIVSGGQTGVDRAALDVALQLGLDCGGWCPRGRRAEDGPIPDRYPVRETPSADYPERTEWNVCDSDGTLILARGTLQGGTALTREWAERLGKPCLVVDLNQPHGAEEVRRWAESNRVRVLNVAGPREGDDPGIYEQAVGILRELLA